MVQEQVNPLQWKLFSIKSQTSGQINRYSSPYSSNGAAKCAAQVVKSNIILYEIPRGMWRTVVYEAGEVPLGTTGQVPAEFAAKTLLHTRLGLILA